MGVPHCDQCSTGLEWTKGGDAASVYLRRGIYNGRVFSIVAMRAVLPATLEASVHLWWIHEDARC